MIQLKNICKDYVSGDIVVHALKNINVTFRKNEFVAILGPSGGGKTTTLNIVGGLDKYTSGDLVINGTSTVDFTDRDWDSYRNHSVGFVFQSYNLIPHQTVLSNVELALTISGNNSKQRKEQARKALEAVGLGDQCYKKPNQLSGGQMQRVAIARALVNNPDILLADEPTGALDSQSSIQVMELLKEIASDRLVVMVTHNPELADMYANRIIRIKDGEIVDDTNPFDGQEEEVNGFVPDKTSMSFLTALALSCNNLLTKKARTLLTAFAGSIGIIGISLILALSTGVDKYIDDVQANSLSSYPLTIQNSTADMTSMMGALMTSIKDTEYQENTVTEIPAMVQMMNEVGTNDLKSFKHYLEDNWDEIDPLVNGIRYDYGIRLNIYNDETDKGIIRVNPSSMSSGYMGMGSAFQQMLDNDDLLQKQYTILEGRWPEKYDECLLILQNERAIADVFLYSMGFRDPAEMREIFTSIMNGEKVEINNERMSLTYQQLMEKKYRVVLPTDKYKYNSEYGVWEDMSNDSEYMKNVLKQSLQLNIVGIVIPNDDASSMRSGIGYRSDLVEYVIRQTANKKIVIDQLANKEVDVFSGKTFEQINKEEKSADLNFENMITVDNNALNSAFSFNVDINALTKTISNQFSKVANNITDASSDVYNDIYSTFVQLCEGMLNNYIDEHGISSAATYDQGDIDKIISEYFATNQADNLINIFATKYSISSSEAKQIFSPLLRQVLVDYLAAGLDSGFDEAYLTRDNIAKIIVAASQNENFRNSLQSFSDRVTQNYISKSLNPQLQSALNSIVNQLARSMRVDGNKIAKAFKFNMDEQELNRVMNAMMRTSRDDRNALTNLNELGYADLEDPTEINIYFSNFENKDTFKEVISRYNDEKEKADLSNQQINYTDITGILMSSITTIINAISYVLVAFVSVSLIVSSIMIGIITYISVLERTKEIGILRALGASKGNVGNVFNAETFIIGLISGVLGIAITLLLIIPINIIIKKVTEINNIGAVLPTEAGIILILISIFLTMVAGLVPSSIASKRDPVEALRSE